MMDKDTCMSLIGFILILAFLMLIYYAMYPSKKTCKSLYKCKLDSSTGKCKMSPKKRSCGCQDDECNGDHN